MYRIQHFVTKFVSDLQQIGGFLRVLRFSSVNKTDLHDITEILLKVALKTINLFKQLEQTHVVRMDKQFLILVWHPSCH
jgi:hypothetical protein